MEPPANIEENQLQNPGQSKVKSMSDILQTHFIYGYDGQLKDNILVVKDGLDRSAPSFKVIYTVGSTVVFVSPDQKKQSYIHASEGSKGITAIQLSESNRYLAFSEETDTQGIIYVYDLHKMPDYQQRLQHEREKATQNQKGLQGLQGNISQNRHANSKSSKLNLQGVTNQNKGNWEQQWRSPKMLVLGQNDIKSYSQLSFHTKDEGKYLASLSSDGCKLVLWEWNKSKAWAQVKVDLDVVNHMFFHPHDHTLFCLGEGTHTSRAYTIRTDKSTVLLQQKPEAIKDNQRQMQGRILSYAVLEGDWMVLGNDEGHLYIINQNYEYKVTLPNDYLAGNPITNILRYQSGFIVAGQNCTFYTFQRGGKDLKHYTANERKVSSKAHASVLVNSFNLFNRDYLIVGLKNGSLIQVYFTLDKNLTDDNFKFSDFIQSFHVDRIEDMDVCYKKRLLATCGQDKMVKIWNYAENSLEVEKRFDQKANAIAFHPSGFHITVAFQDKVKMINLLYKDMKPFKDIGIPNCRKLCYSNGGQYVAIANGSAVQLYHSYTGELLGSISMRGHTLQIKEIKWAPNDLRVYSAGLDGNLIEWNLYQDDNQHSVTMISSNNVLFTSFDIASESNDKHGKYIIANSANEKQIYLVKNEKKEIDDKENADRKRLVAYPHKTLNVGAKISSVMFCRSNKYLLMGTTGAEAPGMVRAYNYPLTGECQSLQAHKGGVIKLLTSYSEDYIFSIGEDNALMVFKLIDREALSKHKTGAENTASEADDCLYDKEKFRSIKNEIDRLRKQNKEIEMKNEHLKRAEEEKTNNEVNNLKDQHARSSMEEGHKTEELKRKIKEKDEFYSKELKKKRQEHVKQKTLNENLQNQKLANQQKLYQEKNEKKAENFKKYKEEKEQLEQSCQIQLQELNEKYTKLLEEAVKAQIEIQQDKEYRHQDHERQITEEEHLTDKLIIDLKKREENDRNEKINKKTTQEYELGQVRDKHRILQQDKRTKEHEVRDIQTNIDGLFEQINAKKKEKETNEKELDDRKHTLEQKDTRIKELVRKTRELEKFKFVLDYKIKELRQEIGPREEDIAKMKEQLSNMKGEVEYFDKINTHLKLFVNDQYWKIKGQNETIKKQDDTISYNQSYIMSYEQEMNKVLKVLLNYKSLKKEIVNVYNKYVQNKVKNLDLTGDKQKKDIANREYLEICINTMKRNFKNNQKMHSKDGNRILKENVDLTGAINELKREKKQREDTKDYYVELRKMDLDDEVNRMKKQVQANKIKIENMEKRVKELQDRPPPSSY